jgi:hypothetical protein
MERSTGSSSIALDYLGLIRVPLYNGRYMRRLGEDGYTLQELLAATGLTLLLVILGLILVHPKDYSSMQRDADRQVGVAELMQGIHAYVAHTGYLPADIPTKMEPIGGAKGQVDLCSALVPTYLKTIPVDPLFGTAIHCNTKDQYITGYAIEKTGKGNQVIIAALAAERKLIYLSD